MKFIFTIFTLLIFYSVNAQTAKSHSNDSFEIKINQLENKINSIKENQLSIDLIQEYKDLNNLYSFGFTILLGLFGIVFPILLYIIQIKPAQDALKEAKQLLAKIDENFEKSFEEHLRKSKIKQIDLAIESYERNDDQNLPTSYIHLENYKSEIFSKIQIFRLLALLNRSDIDGENKEFFARLLTFQQSNEIEKYFVDLITGNPKDKKCIWGALYFANNAKKEHLNLVSDIVLHGHPLVSMLSSLSFHSKGYAIELLQHEKLAKNLKDNDIINFCRGAETVFANILDIDKIKETLIWKKYVELASKYPI
jgi:hypothetical protein